MQGYNHDIDVEATRLRVSSRAAGSDEGPGRRSTLGENEGKQLPRAIVGNRLLRTKGMMNAETVKRAVVAQFGKGKRYSTL